MLADGKTGRTTQRTSAERRGQRPPGGRGWPDSTCAGRIADGRHAVFFFNDPATTEIYTLSLHDALPINDTATTEIYTLSLHDVFDLGGRRIISKHPRGGRRGGGPRRRGRATTRGCS